MSMTPSERASLREIATKARKWGVTKWRAVQCYVHAEGPEGEGVQIAKVGGDLRDKTMRGSFERWNAEADHIAANSPDVTIALLDESEKLREALNGLKTAMAKEVIFNGAGCSAEYLKAESAARAALEG
jgi:hypothetical protein